MNDFPEVMKYLTEERNLLPETIKEAGIWVYTDEKDNDWIAIPTGKESAKLRAAPNNNATGKGRYFGKDTSAKLYGADDITQDDTRIIICEGEIDRLLLKQLGFCAVTSTSGAGTFQEEWLGFFPKDCDIVLCFDNDEAGNEGREKVRELFHKDRKDVGIHDVFWKPEKKKGYDVSDFYAELKAKALTEEQIAEVFCRGIKKWKPIIDGGEGYKRPIASVRKPLEDVTYADWKNCVQENFPALWGATECCAAVIAQLLIQDTTNCFGLILIDVPSSGKTICLNFFTGLEEIVYSSDDFTPAALVSHAAQKSSKDLTGVDMLPKIRFKTLVIREMAAIFGDKDDELRKKMHLLTRVMDGEGLETESGIHGKRGYQGDYLFTLLGASTPISLRVWKVMGGAGHRLFFLSLNSKRIGVEGLHEMLMSGGYKKKEVAVKEKTHDFLRGLWRKNPKGIVWDSNKDEVEATLWIARMAHFLAHFRGEILVYTAWSESGKELQHTRPQIEQPMRVMTLLYGLARGRAVLEGRNYITMADLKVVARLTIDTAPDPRPQVLQQLMTNEKVSAASIAQAMKCTVTTAKKEMEKLIVLGVAKNEGGFTETVEEELETTEPWLKESVKGEISLADEFSWLRSKEFHGIMQS